MTASGYSVEDLSGMGGDEIRAMDTRELAGLRRRALNMAKLYLDRAARASEYLSYRKLGEDDNLGLIEAARVALEEVKP